MYIIKRHFINSCRFAWRTKTACFLLIYQGSISAVNDLHR
jgi:hypothetical protein